MHFSDLVVIQMILLTFLVMIALIWAYFCRGGGSSGNRSNLNSISGTVASIARKLSNTSKDLPPSYSRVSYPFTTLQTFVPITSINTAHRWIWLPWVWPSTTPLTLPRHMIPHSPWNTPRALQLRLLKPSFALWLSPIRFPSNLCLEPGDNSVSKVYQQISLQFSLIPNESDPSCPKDPPDQEEFHSSTNLESSWLRITKSVIMNNCQINSY